MYNRYIPQGDGSHRRRFVPDPPKMQPCPPSPPVPEPECAPPPAPPAPPRRQSCPARQETGAFGFLKNLLPGDFDTGDLMIILLLLLMGGDCQEDQNWAWLTLALYLFL